MMLKVSHIKYHCKIIEINVQMNVILEMNTNTSRLYERILIITELPDIYADPFFNFRSSRASTQTTYLMKLLNWYNSKYTELEDPNKTSLTFSGSM